MNNEEKFIFDNINQFPHCDPRILHAPSTCVICDMHPEWQALRIAWGISFTGHSGFDGKATCPAEQSRPLETINRWYGNVPHKEVEVSAEPKTIRPIHHDIRIHDEDLETFCKIVEEAWNRFVGEKASTMTLHNMEAFMRSEIWTKLPPEYSKNLIVKVEVDDMMKGETHIKVGGNDHIVALQKAYTVWIKSSQNS